MNQIIDKIENGNTGKELEEIEEIEEIVKSHEIEEIEEIVKSHEIEEIIKPHEIEEIEEIVKPHEIEEIEEIEEIIKPHEIYKLTIGEGVYIGSTTIGFHNRLIRHKARYNKYFNDACLYKYIMENGGWEAVTSEVIGTVDVPEENETLIHSLRIAEGRVIEKLKGEGINILNKNKPHVKNRINYNKRWREQNPDYHKKYYTENKSKIIARSKQKAECPICKKHVRKYYLKKHQLTRNCKKFQTS